MPKATKGQCFCSNDTVPAAHEFLPTQVVVKRQPSAGRRPPRGAMTESTTLTTTTTIATLSAAGTAGGTPTSAGSTASASVSSSNGGAGYAAPLFRTATGTSTASSTENDCRDAVGGSGGERGPTTTGGGSGSRHASEGAVETNRGGQEAGGVAGGGGGEGEGEGEGRGDGTMMENNESLVANEAGARATAAKTTPPAVAATIGAAVSRLENVCRIWELQPFEALSARERGMLPDQHPMQVSPEVCNSSSCILFILISSKPLCFGRGRGDRGCARYVLSGLAYRSFERTIENEWTND